MVRRCLWWLSAAFVAICGFPLLLIVAKTNMVYKLLIFVGLIVCKTMQALMTLCVAPSHSAAVALFGVVFLGFVLYAIPKLRKWSYNRQSCSVLHSVAEHKEVPQKMKMRLDSWRPLYETEKNNNESLYMFVSRWQNKLAVMLWSKKMKTKALSLLSLHAKKRIKNMKTNAFSFLSLHAKVRKVYNDHTKNN
jgi:hypothetical protein